MPADLPLTESQIDALADILWERLRQRFRIDVNYRQKGVRIPPPSQSSSSSNSDDGAARNSIT